MGEDEFDGDGPGGSEREEHGPARKGRLGRFTRRVIDRGEDARELMLAALETSDRAKTEMVRMVAREVRTYLDALELKDDLYRLVSEHSLEVHASLHLKKLPSVLEKEAERERLKGTDEEPAADE